MPSAATLGDDIPRGAGHEIGGELRELRVGCGVASVAVETMVACPPSVSLPPHTTSRRDAPGVLRGEDERADIGIIAALGGDVGGQRAVGAVREERRHRAPMP